MECRRFLDELARTRAVGTLTVDLQQHAEACQRCGLQLRARRLLDLGSRLSLDAPRAGFAARLGPRLGARRSRADWPDAIGLVVRPAFGLAAATLLVTVGLYYSVVATPSTRDDLALLTESDPVVSVLLSGRPMELLAPSEHGAR